LPQTDRQNPQPPNDEYYQKLKGAICDLYPDGLDEQEADEATRNFIGFGKLLLEIKCRQAQARSHDEA